MIIPVYKTEKYLADCVNSVLRQSYANINIILVDDGSPDKCPAMCDEFAKKYENIKVIHQENRGLGLSRNTGVKGSDGKFIMFLDSDDMLDGEDAIKKIVEKAIVEDADITVGCYRRFDGENISGINYHHLKGGSYTHTADFRFRGFYKYGHLAYNWGKLYKREFLEKNDIECQAYPFTQDKAHNMRCLACMPKYAFIKDSVCLYRVNENSVTFRYKENLMSVWIQIAGDFVSFLKERGINEDYEELIALHLFFGSFFLVKQELEAKKGFFSAVRVVKKYSRDPLVRDEMKALSRGAILNDIHDKRWKSVVKTASFFFSKHLYMIFVAGIVLVRSMGIDTGITRSRYRRSDATRQG